jgi:Zn-dependent peptidase ImmA (M78 family)/transcriptional regulator with XRE-family HTH domain
MDLGGDSSAPDWTGGLKMAVEQIPVTPSLIAWARARAGLSVEEAIKAFPKIESWEAGEAFPTYSQLEQLAEKFKLPIAVFFFPEPPRLPPIEETFRTLPAAQFAEIPGRVKYFLRKAKALQLNLVELTGGRPSARRMLTRDLAFPPNASMNKMASSVRGYLEVSIDTQRGWQNDEVAFEQWRKALHGVGINIFKDAFRTDAYSGFSLYDEAFPIIYVNNTTGKTRQIFTVFHELAHLLFQTSGIDSVTDDYIPQLPEEAQRIEVICNRFAAILLIPDAEFKAALGGRDPSEETAADGTQGQGTRIPSRCPCRSYLPGCLGEAQSTRRPSASAMAATAVRLRAN